MVWAKPWFLFLLWAGLLPLWLIGIPVCWFHQKQCLSKPTCTAFNKKVTASVCLSPPALIQVVIQTPLCGEVSFRNILQPVGV